MYIVYALLRRICTQLPSVVSRNFYNSYREITLRRVCRNSPTAARVSHISKPVETRERAGIFYVRGFRTLFRRVRERKFVLSAGYLN